MAKSLSDILAGVKSSKTEPMDLKDLAMSPEGNKGQLDFAKKHKVEKHDDRAGNDDHIYQGTTKKTTKYKFQKDGVYEESNCNHTMEGTYCPMHEKAACPSEDDVNTQPKSKKDSKGRQLLADKKLKEDIINEVAPPSPKIEKWIKANKERFVKEYGKEKGTQVLYAKAWKMHGQSESGSATNTDYTGPGAAGWTTGRLDVGTL